MIASISTPFNNAQLELLKLFSNDLKEAELKELKQILLEFKFRRVTKMVDEIWDEKGWTEETMNTFLNTHERTPYKAKEQHDKYNSTEK
jgi:hypothetical protein